MLVLWSIQSVTDDLILAEAQEARNRDTLVSVLVRNRTLDFKYDEAGRLISMGEDRTRSAIAMIASATARACNYQWALARGGS